MPGLLWESVPVVESADDPLPVPEALATELALVARAGARSSHKLVDNVPILSALRIVRSRATSDEPREYVLRMADVLDQAVDRIEEGPTQAAARILLGLDRQESGNLTARRIRAANALFGRDARNERTFRGTDEPELLRRVAENLYLMEVEHRSADAGTVQSEVLAVDPPDGVAEGLEVHDTSLRTATGQDQRAGQDRRRRGLWIGAAAVVAVLVVVVVAVSVASDGSRESPAPSTVLSEPFSARNRGWSDDAFFHYDDETYVGVLAPGAPDGRSSRAPVTPGRLPSDLRISVDGTKTSEGRGGSFGVFCRDSGGLRYGARIDPESQSYTIYKVETRGDRGRPLVPQVVSGSIRGTGLNTVALACTGDGAGQGPVNLTLYVNGDKVKSYEDPTGYPSGSVGVEIASGSAGVVVRFDNLEVSRA
jgi:hypothetical protein